MTAQNEIIQVLMYRDGVNEIEANIMLEECRQMVRNGDDPEDVLREELGLEPDYIFDLI